MPTPPPPGPSPRSLWQRLVQTLNCSFEWLFLRELPLLQLVAPSVIRPDFTWGHHVLAPGLLPPEMPPVSPLLAPAVRGAIGHIHVFLGDFSRYYCAWFGTPYCHTISPLPFGLLLKWSDGTNLDEVRSMRVIRAAGIPAPKVISYGEHPDTPWAPVSILMTRLPGEELGLLYEDLDTSQRDTIIWELKTILKAIRCWKNPWGQRICSISGCSIRSIRVPNHRIEPCESESEFNKHLLSTASSHSFKTREEYEKTLSTARKLTNLQHGIVFTHGDLALHNILVYKGHVSGFIDWECAGWYPEYWEFTTPLRWCSRNPMKRSLFLQLGGDGYHEELESELAIRGLTVDSWICM